MQTAARFDDLDWRIFYELDCNAFQSFSQIGKKFRVGRDIIHYRVKRLEELGVIKNYLPLIDYCKTGLMGSTLYLTLQHETPTIRDNIIEYYKERNEIWRLAEMRGAYDITMDIFENNLLELREKKIALLKDYRKYFKDIRFCFYSRRYYFQRDYFMYRDAKKERRAMTIIDERPEKIIDALDEKILTALSENARKPFVKIAEELDISVAQIHYRVDNLMKKKVLLGAKAVIDLAKIGYSRFKLHIYLDDYNAYQDVKNFVFSIPNVVHAGDVIGGADIEVEIEARGYEELKIIEDKIKSRFGAFLSHITYQEVKKEHKLKYPA